MGYLNVKGKLRGVDASFGSFERKWKGQRRVGVTKDNFVMNIRGVRSARPATSDMLTF